MRENVAKSSTPWWMAPLFTKKELNKAERRANPKPIGRRKQQDSSARERRIARASASGPGLSSAEWEAILVKFGSVCLRCGSSKNLVPDHVRPMYRKGINHPSNIQPLCNPCNIWKGLRIIDFRSVNGESS